MLSTLLLSACLLATPFTSAGAPAPAIAVVKLDAVKRASLDKNEAAIVLGLKKAAKEVKGSDTGVEVLHEFLTRDGAFVVLLMGTPIGVVALVGQWDDTPPAGYSFIQHLLE